jgi:UDP-N-acetylmuramate dehydrogenase
MKVENRVDISGIDHRIDYDLAKFSYFKTGGKSDFCFFPKDVKEFKVLIDFCLKSEKSWKTIGATSNLMFLKGHAPEILISLKNFNSYCYDVNLNIITVDAGYRLPSLSRKTAKIGLSGFEGLEGIPGTVGGAIYQNAEAFGDAISDYLLDVTVLSLNGQIIVYKKLDLNYSYRHSAFKDKDLGVILSARFSPNISLSKDHIKSRIDSLNWNRRNYQEAKFPNLGSIFATKDIYMDMARFDYIYWKLLLLARWYLSWTKPQDNKLINAITCLRFGIKFKPQPFSDKTMNCFINAPGVSTNLIIKYIEKMKTLTHNEVKIEIEII